MDNADEPADNGVFLSMTLLDWAIPDWTILD